MILVNNELCSVQFALMCILQGIFLSKVNDVGPSYNAGLRPGDKLLEVWICCQFTSCFAVLVNILE